MSDSRSGESMSDIILASDKRNILLVDDDGDVCAVVQSGLQRYGFNVTTINDPTQALSQFKPERFDMILLDVRMPGMNGFQLAKQIWTRDPDARIAFFSAFEIYEKEAKVIFRDLKTVRFIKKPVVIKELAARLSEELEHPAETPE